MTAAWMTLAPVAALLLGYWLGRSYGYFEGRLDGLARAREIVGRDE